MLNNLFLSVGAMKAGTTWLYHHLRSHPEIHFTPEKEIHYFANKVGIETQLSHRNRIIKLKRTMEKHVKGNPKYLSEHLDEIAWYAGYALPQDISNEWYESLFARNPGKKICADFSNLYCQMEPEAWLNVRSIATRLKVIYTLRDPLERVWSHYKFHMKWLGREDEVITAGFDTFRETVDKPFFWINADYAGNFRRLQASLQGDELMLLYFEDFRSEPQRMLAEVQKFLEIHPVAPAPETLDEHVNQTKYFGMPDEWHAYIADKLRPASFQMRNSGIWHPRWTPI